MTQPRPSRDGLLAALEQRNVEALEQAVSHASSAEMRRALEVHGHAAMVMAIRCGRPALVRRLLDAGVSANATSPFGDPVLLEAAAYGEVQAAHHLLQAGANVEAVDPRTGATVLLEAARFGQSTFIQMLLLAGANTAATDRDGANALTLAMLNNHDGAAAVLRAAGVKEQPQYAQDIEQMRQAITDAARQMEEERRIRE